MVSFKFNTSKVANFTTDVPSKHGFQLKDAGYIFLDFLNFLKKKKKNILI